MLYKREGLPEEDELVLCTVTAVQGHCVFAKLDEYDKVGMIHISEVSPGRIRNIRDFVIEGKKIVCKVLKVDKKKAQIDLSLRRVNEGQKRKKLDEIKQEQKAEKIIEAVAHKLNIDIKELYNKIGSKVFEKYLYMYEFFNDVVSDSVNLKKLGIEEGIAKELIEAVKEKIKLPKVLVKGAIKLRSYAPDGIEIIKAALKKAEGEGITIKYLGGGEYSIAVNAPNYKEAEKKLKSSIEKITKYIEKKKGVAEFKKEGR